MAAPEHPFNDSDLSAFSAEHVLYEVGMFFWAVQKLTQHHAAVMGSHANTKSEVDRLNNALIEVFLLHLRNLVNFLYPRKRIKDDIVAADFCAPEAWDREKPPITDTLVKARDRADKQLAHLTSKRIAGTSPEKGFDFSGLASEIRPLLRRFVDNAQPARLSRNVAAVIR